MTLPLRPLVLAILLAGGAATFVACRTDEGEGLETQVPDSPPPRNQGPGILDPAGSAEGSDVDPVPAPAFEVETLSGSRFTLADHRDEVILVNFWATWCGPCIVEIPDLQELYDTYREQGFMVVGVSVEDGEEDLVRAFVAEYAMTYPVAISSDLADEFGGVYGLPTSFLIDKNGQVVERVIGLFPTEQMRPRIEAMLDAPSV